MDINEDIIFLPVGDDTKNIWNGDEKSNKLCSRQLKNKVYFKGFDVESYTYWYIINIFEMYEIAEIYTKEVCKSSKKMYYRCQKIGYLLE